MSSYIRRTCIYCRQKRKKCDGKSPCSVCVSLNHNCIYQPEIDRRRRKYNTDYVEYLESKSQKLENFILDFVKDDKDLEFNAKDIIKSLTLRIPNNNNNNNDSKDGEFSSSSTNSNSNNNLNDSNAESQFSNLSSSINHRSNTLTELGDDIAFNELLTMAKNMSLENNDQKNDSNKKKNYNYKNSAFNDGMNASQNYQHRRNELLSSKYSNSNNLPDDFPLKIDGISVSFADESFRQELIHNFVNHCCEVSYIVSLTLPTITSWEFPSANPSHHLLMCTVYGMGCIFSSNQYAKEVTKILISEAENMVLSTCRFESNQYLVQSLFLLSCYEMGNGNDSISYLFISMAAALTQHMGYHISYDENSSAARFAPKTTHYKSALLWSICTQDRIVTTSLGVPSCIHFKRIISPFYSPESSMNSEDKDNYLLEISFSYISRLWYILDRFLDQICSIQGDIGDTQERSKLVLTAKNTLIDLKALLPTQLKNVEKIGNYHILMFHLNYEVCFILLYRLLLNELPLEGSNNCISSALNATKLIERLVYSINDFIPSYQFGYLVNTVAIVLLVYLVERNTKSKNDNKMGTSSIRKDIYYNSFITCLKALYLDTRYWSRSLNNIKLLSDFAIMNGFHCDELIYTDNLIKIAAANSQSEFENSEFENSEFDNSEFDSESVKELNKSKSKLFNDNDNDIIENSLMNSDIELISNPRTDNSSYSGFSQTKNDQDQFQERYSPSNNYTLDQFKQNQRDYNNITNTKDVDDDLLLKFLEQENNNKLANNSNQRMMDGQQKEDMRSSQQQKQHHHQHQHQQQQQYSQETQPQPLMQQQHPMQSQPLQQQPLQKSLQQQKQQQNFYQFNNSTDSPISDDSFQSLDQTGVYMSGNFPDKERLNRNLAIINAASMRQLESYENYMSSTQTKNTTFNNNEGNIQYGNEKFNTRSLFATEPESNSQTYSSSTDSQMSKGAAPLSDSQTPQPPMPYTANILQSQLTFSPPLQQFYPAFNGPQNFIPTQQKTPMQTFNQQSQQQPQKNTQLNSQGFMDPNQKQFQPNQFPQHQEQQSQQPPQQSVTTPMASIFTPPQVIFTPPNMNSNATPSNITPPNYGGLQQNFTNKVTNNVAATQNYTPSPQLQQLQEMGYPDYLYSVQDPSVNPNANSSSNSNSN